MNFNDFKQLLENSKGLWAPVQDPNSTSTISAVQYKLSKFINDRIDGLADAAPYMSMIMQLNDVALGDVMTVEQFMDMLELGDGPLVNTTSHEISSICISLPNGFADALIISYIHAHSDTSDEYMVTVRSPRSSWPVIDVAWKPNTIDEDHPSITHLVCYHSARRPLPLVNGNQYTIADCWNGFVENSAIFSITRTVLDSLITGITWNAAAVADVLSLVTEQVAHLSLGVKQALYTAIQGGTDGLVMFFKTMYDWIGDIALDEATSDGQWGEVSTDINISSFSWGFVMATVGTVVQAASALLLGISRVAALITAVAGTIINYIGKVATTAYERRQGTLYHIDGGNDLDCLMMVVGQGTLSIADVPDLNDALEQTGVASCILGPITAICYGKTGTTCSCQLFLNCSYNLGYCLVPTASDTLSATLRSLTSSDVYSTTWKYTTKNFILNFSGDDVAYVGLPVGLTNRVDKNREIFNDAPLVARSRQRLYNYILQSAYAPINYRMQTIISGYASSWEQDLVQRVASGLLLFLYWYQPQYFSASDFNSSAGTVSTEDTPTTSTPSTSYSGTLGWCLYENRRVNIRSSSLYPSWYTPLKAGELIQGLLNLVLNPDSTDARDWLLDVFELCFNNLLMNFYSHAGNVTLNGWIFDATQSSVDGALVGLQRVVDYSTSMNYLFWSSTASPGTSDSLKCLAFFSSYATFQDTTCMPYYGNGTFKVQLPTLKWSGYIAGIVLDIVVGVLAATVVALSVVKAIKLRTKAKQYRAIADTAAFNYGDGKITWGEYKMANIKATCYEVLSFSHFTIPSSSNSDSGIMQSLKNLSASVTNPTPDQLNEDITKELSLRDVLKVIVG